MTLPGAPRRPQVFIVLEGGRSRTDELDLARLETALGEVGMAVETLHHGLGALALRALRQGLSQARPDLIITTGALSTAHLRRVALFAGCPILCCLWPAAGAYTLPRLGRNGPRPGPAPAPPWPTRFLLASPAARARLLAELRGEFPPERVHLLPPPVAPFDSEGPTETRTAARGDGPLRLGVLGAERPRSALPLPAGLSVAVEWLHPVGRGGALLPQAALAGLDAVLALETPQLGDEGPRLCAEVLRAGKALLCLDDAPLPDRWPLGDLGTHRRPFEVVPAADAAARLSVVLAPDEQGLAERRRLGEAAARFAARALAPDVVFGQVVALCAEAIEDRSVATLPRRFFRQAAAQALRSAPVLRRRARRVALAYHQIVNDLRGWDPYLVVSASALERQVQALLRAGYQAVPMAELAVAPDSDDRPLFAVTFDDGYEDTLEVAAPVLAALRAPFTVYLITDMLSGALRAPWYEVVAHAVQVPALLPRTLPLLRGEPGLRPILAERHPGPLLAQQVVAALKVLPAGRRAALVAALAEAGGEALFAAVPRYLGAERLPALVAAGAELGSHTRTHPLLQHLGDEALRREILESRVALKNLGYEAPGLAYPNGDSDERVRALAAAAGYRYAVAVTDPAPGGGGVFNLPRRMVGEPTARGFAGAARFDEAMFLAWATAVH